VKDEPAGLSPEEWAAATAPSGAPRRPVREDRATRLLLLLGALGAFAVLFSLAGSTDVSSVERLVRTVSPILWVIGAFIASAGLIARRPWAVGSLTMTLALIIAGGILAVIASIGHGAVFIPVAAILAIWVLRAPSSAPARPGLGLGGMALVAVFVLASIGPWAADAALAPGGPLAVSAADIAPVLSLDCGVPGQGIPETMTGSFDWSWRRTDAWPDSTDMVVVGWAGEDDGGTQLFILDDATPSSPHPGIWQGGGSPSQALADQFAGRFGGFDSWSWGVSLAEQHMAPGNVPFSLRRVSDQPVGHGVITLQAAYVHLGKWINTDAEATCSW